MKIVSFGVMNRPPSVVTDLYGDNVTFTDALWLPNPYKVPYLRSLDGRSKKVQNWLLDLAPKEIEDWMRGKENLMRGTRWSEEDFVLAINCYGGHHRSVAMAEMLAPRLRKMGLKVDVVHMELK